MKINAQTKICCVIGDPIQHSLSPAIHNTGYKSLGLNFVYTAFRVENLKDAVLGFRALGIRGISVTVPHKVSVMPLLNKIDNKAKEIGAVNTIVNDNGTLTGYNTDSPAALRALKEITSLINKKTVIIGAGGAARAIAFGLKGEKTDVLIINRTPEKAKTLAKETNSRFGGLSKLCEIKNADVIINATSAGMHPDTNTSIISQDFLRENQTVFDIVYNPKETLLIKYAKLKKCKIVYGYKMLLHQAALQFEMFTGLIPPVDIMEKTLLNQLEKNIN